MYPADWIWQQYGLCLGWRCSQCKEKVLARSLPFKGLRRRKADPDEARDLIEARDRRSQEIDQRQTSEEARKAGARRHDSGSERREASGG